jgi:predicted RNase H-like nuclease (RuvC/YqgF family)
MTSNQENGETMILSAGKTESAEECTKRLSRRLTEYEAASIDIEGRANQIRKERDVERALNQKLRKEIEKLTCQLLRERMRIAALENEVKKFDSRKHEEQLSGKS